MKKAYRLKKKKTIIRESEASEIIDELKDIKSELASIKKHIIDVDCILTDDDLAALKKADEEFKKGKTKRLI